MEHFLTNKTRFFTHAALRSCLLSVLLFLFYANFVFSQDIEFSAGTGLHTGIDFNELNATIDGGEYKQRWTQANIGGLLFFDATYAEASILFLGTSTTFSSNEKLREVTGVYDNWELGGVYLGFSLLGKYPIEISDEWIIFPLLGIQFDIGLAQNYTKDYAWNNTEKGDSYGKAIDWSALSIKAGIGADYSFLDPYFFRAEILYDFRLNSALDTAYFNNVGTKFHPDIFYDITMGFSVKIVVGYKIGGTTISTAARRQQPRQPRRPSRGSGNTYYPK
ncbi:MAG: hypothetical protein Ta2B_23380 [Termitinemataceae bacterium]|nr:MAG: hypothetical protein Ta2B_23380 [Termitinemataceae bacterium]